MATSDHHAHVRELVIHGVAFCIAAGVGAIILYRYYWFFEAHTQDASEARNAFLTSVAVIGGVGPALTGLFFWFRGMTRKLRE